MQQYLLSIDQGTTLSRAIVFNYSGIPVSHHDLPLNQSFPQDGWVEQDPDEMFTNIVECCRQALSKNGLTSNMIAAIGITNQRETTILWDKNSGKSIYPAIVWQDRRTSTVCKQLAKTAFNKLIQQKTGLLIDPYFSATKILWILDHVPDARKRAVQGDILFGTVDTYLLWKLTQGQSHLTDATNAARTLLFNIQTQQWDQELLEQFNIPEQILPKVVDNTFAFGEMVPDILGRAIPITGMAGDQQASLIGQACFTPGMAKITYGTGCFMLLNTGTEIVQSQHHLLTTVAYRIHNKVTFGLEGSIFSAGSIIKWLRDQLQIIHSAEETETISKSIVDTGGVYFIPAFTGLGAPYWDPHARAAFFGLTHNTGREQLVRAALESIAFQTKDLLEAIRQDYHGKMAVIRVDGGMATNNWLLQFICDLLNVALQRPKYTETTALGVAFLAGLQVGIYHSLEEIAKLWEMNTTFSPHMSSRQREDLYLGWQDCIKRTLS